MLHYIWILIKAGVPIAITSFGLVWWAARKDYLGGASTLDEYEKWKKADDRARKAAKKEQKAQRKAERKGQSTSASADTGSVTGRVPDSASDTDSSMGGLDVVTPGTKQESVKRKSDFLHSKWMEFGGGFYGVVALFTYIIIEIGEVKDFLAGLAHLFDNGLIGLVISFFINSIMNFITAIAWPAYWLSRIHSEQWLWMIGAYGGYWLGARAAFRYSQQSAGR